MSNTFSVITSLGSAPGPLFVLLPGGLGLSSQGLIPLAQRLVEKGNPTILVDPPGTAQARPLPEFSFQSIGRDVASALETLHRPLVLVGHSFAGKLAMELLRYPSLDVRGMAILNCPLTEKNWDEIQKGSLQRRTKESARIEEKFLNAPTDENFREWFVSLAPAYFGKSYLKQGEAYLKKDPLSAALFLGTVTAMTEFTDERLLALPGALPKLLLAGEYDALMPLEAMREDAKKGRFEFEVVRGSGHFTPLEAPEETARLLVAWWKKHARA